MILLEVVLPCSFVYNCHSWVVAHHLVLLNALHLLLLVVAVIINLRRVQSLLQLSGILGWGVVTLLLHEVVLHVHWAVQVALVIVEDVSRQSGFLKRVGTQTVIEAVLEISNLPAWLILVQLIQRLIHWVASVVSQLFVVYPFQRVVVKLRRGCLQTSSQSSCKSLALFLPHVGKGTVGSRSAVGEGSSGNLVSRYFLTGLHRKFGSPDGICS